MLFNKCDICREKKQLYEIDTKRLCAQCQEAYELIDFDKEAEERDIYLSKFLDERDGLLD